MLGDGSAAGRACPSRPGAISRSLPCAALAALMVLGAAFAQDKPIDLPEVRVIANTPLARPSHRTASRPKTPAARAVGAPRRTNVVSRPVRATAPAAPAVDP